MKNARNLSTSTVTLTFILVLGFATSQFSQLLAQTINSTLVYKVKSPSKKTNKTPVLIMLHGYGSNEEDLFDIANALDERFMTFSLRAPMPMQNNGYCWYKLGEAPDRSFKYDYLEAKLSREKVIDFIFKACRAYQLDSQSVYLLGFSQGAILSYDIALSAPGKIRGVLALSGRLMDQSKTLTANWTKLTSTSFFIAHGKFDNVIPINAAESADTFLRSKGLKNVQFKAYPMQHVINGEELNDIKKWLSKSITPEEIQEIKKNPTNSSKK